MYITFKLASNIVTRMVMGVVKENQKTPLPYYGEGRGRFPIESQFSFR